MEAALRGSCWRLWESLEERDDCVFGSLELMGEDRRMCHPHPHWSYSRKVALAAGSCFHREMALRVY